MDASSKPRGNRDEFQGAVRRLRLALDRPKITVKELRSGDCDLDSRVAGHLANRRAVDGEHVRMADREEADRLHAALSACELVRYFRGNRPCVRPLAGSRYGQSSPGRFVN